MSNENVTQIRPRPKRPRKAPRKGAFSFGSLKESMLPAAHSSAYRCM